MYTQPNTIIMDLPTTVRGFTTFGGDGEPVVILNAKLSHEQQRKTYAHELRHIQRGDLWNEEYTDEVEYGGSA